MDTLTSHECTQTATLAPPIATLAPPIATLALPIANLASPAHCYPSPTHCYPSPAHCHPSPAHYLSFRWAAELFGSSLEEGTVPLTLLLTEAPHEALGEGHNGFHAVLDLAVAEVLEETTERQLYRLL